MTSSSDAIQRALEHARAGERDAARRILREVLARDRSNVQAWALLAQIAERRVEALNYIQEVLRLEPGSQWAADFLARRFGMTVSELGIEQTEMVRCPYLGLRDDPTVAYSFPVMEGDHDDEAGPSPHRCYRVDPPAPIGREHQYHFCLKAQYRACSVYSGKPAPRNRPINEAVGQETPEPAYSLDSSLHKFSSWNLARASRVVDGFMRAMHNQNPEQAYSLFSEQARKQISLSEIQDLLTVNGALFNDYRGLADAEARVDPTLNTDIPPGKGMRFSAVVVYESGFEGEINATFQREDDGWNLHFIDINVPPDKFAE